eukprot:922201-Amorphochlora_amoeboformis.AAC.1
MFYQSGRIQYLCVGNLEGVLVAKELVDKDEDEGKVNFWPDHLRDSDCASFSFPSSARASASEGSTSKRSLHTELDYQCILILPLNLQREHPRVCRSEVPSQALQGGCKRPRRVTKSASLNARSVLGDFSSFFWKALTDDSDFLNAKEGSLSKKSKTVFEELIKKHGPDKIAETKGKVAPTIAATLSIATLKNQMAKNMEQQLQNIEDLEDTESRARDLEQEGESFQQTAVAVKWKMCWKNAKWTIIISTTVIIILIIIIVVAVCIVNPDACKSE